ncbi:hypothetical protein [Pasteuria penetrans]|uniref:hypothetical protein n=1 Tax=Pasteuria penetrans TaxID=86005 RepID=UPI000FA75A15|nr:hypothetical protein [Pasteuria penetrans]
MGYEWYREGKEVERSRGKGSLKLLFFLGGFVLLQTLSSHMFLPSEAIVFASEQTESQFSSQQKDRVVMPMHVNASLENFQSGVGEGVQGEPSLKSVVGSWGRSKDETWNYIRSRPTYLWDNGPLYLWNSGIDKVNIIKNNIKNSIKEWVNNW